MAGRVIVVGSVNVDLVVRAAHLPQPGETVTGGSFERHHGGKGGNQAVAAARLGAATEFVGAVGGDDLGHEARAALEAEGVGLGGLVMIPGIATGVALIVVDATGENLIAVAGGANAALEPAHVSAALRSLEPTGPGTSSSSATRSRRRPPPRRSIVGARRGRRRSSTRLPRAASTTVSSDRPTS